MIAASCGAPLPSHDDKMRALASAANDFSRGTPPQTRYLIYSLVRSGSTFLCAFLHQTGQAGVPAEYLDGRLATPLLRRLGKEQMALGSYWRELEQLRTSPNGVFGVKAHHFQLMSAYRDVAGVVEAVRRFDRVIVCRRRDKVAQAISYLTAKATDQWQLTAGEQPAQSKADFTDVEITRAIAEIQLQEQEMAEVLERTNPVRLYLDYELLDADPSSYLSRAVEFLNIDVEPNLARMPSLHKQRSDRSEVRRHAYLESLRGAQTGAQPSGTRSDAQSDPNARSALLNALPKGGVGMEIGVHLGDFSKKLLEATKPRLLYLVDPWEYKTDELYKHAWYGGAAKGGSAEMDALVPVDTGGPLCTKSSNWH